jgi:hypothetical protein
VAAHLGKLTDAMGEGVVIAAATRLFTPLQPLGGKCLRGVQAGHPEHGRPPRNPGVLTHSVHAMHPRRRFCIGK